MIILPTKVEESIFKILNSNSSNWVKSAVSLSLEYRAPREESRNFIKSLDDALGYLALRTPATYSQIYGALESVKELNPSWNPSSILDIGSGPGTAIWAAQEIFPDLKTGVAIERDRNFTEIGKNILESFPDLKIDWQNLDLENSLPKFNEGFDLVIIANVLNEVDEKTKNKIIEFAKSYSKGIFIIVEPGTPYGYESIKKVTKQMSSGNILISPYIENSFTDSEEVNFIQRIKRPEFLKRVKQVQRKNDQPNKDRLLPPSDFEESKFYFLAYSKLKPEISVWGRLVEKPKLLKPFVQLRILTKEGVKTERVFKNERDRFKQAKKLKWGDAVNANFEKAII